MKIEVAAHTFLYNGPKVPAYACAFADRTFMNDDGETVLGSPNPQKMANYVKRVAVTGGSGVWEAAAFDGADELDSNTDSVTSETLSTYTVSIFDAKGVFIDYIGRNLKLADQIDPTTWLNIIEYSRARTQPYRAAYYDTNAIDRLLQNLPGGGGGGPEHLNGYPTLANALAAIGATDTDLYILEALVVSADTTIPANVRTVVNELAQISIAAGQTLTINGPFVGGPNVFAGDGSVLFAKGAVDAYRTAWRAGTSGGAIGAAIDEGIANVASWGQGEILIPSGSWTSAGNHTLVSGLTITGTGKARDVDGEGSHITVTAGNPLFEFGEGVYFVKIRGLHLDGDNIANSVAIYGEAAGISALASQGFTFEDLTVRGFEYSIRFNSLTSGWQCAMVDIKNCYFANANTAIFRCNSTNMDSIKFSNCIFNRSTGRGVWAEGVFNIGFDSCSFVANLPNLKGTAQVESNLVVAPSGITGDGSLSVTVTWPGLLASPVTVSVPVTTAMTTAASIATAIANKLENNETLSSEFIIGVDTASARVVLSAIDSAANEAGANFTIETGTATGVTDSLTSTTVATGALPIIGDLPAFEIGNGSNLATFTNCVEEGNGTFVKATAAQVNFNACVLLSQVKGTAPFSTLFTTTGCKITQKTFSSPTAGVDLLTSNGDMPFTFAFIGPYLITVAGTRFVRAGESMYRTIPYEGRVKFGRRVHVHETAETGGDTDVPLVKITSANPTKNLLQLGLQDVHENTEPNAVFNFSRNDPDGHLKISTSPQLAGSYYDGMIVEGGFRSGRSHNTRQYTTNTFDLVTLDTATYNRFKTVPSGDVTYEIGTFEPGTIFEIFIETSGTTRRKITFSTGFSLGPFWTSATSGTKYAFMFYVVDSSRVVCLSDPRNVARYNSGTSISNDASNPVIADGFTGYTGFRNLIYMTGTPAASPASWIGLYSNLFTISGWGGPVNAEVFGAFINVDIGTTNFSTQAGAYIVARLGSVNAGNGNAFYGVAGVAGIGYASVVTNVAAVIGRLQGSNIGFGGSFTHVSGLQAELLAMDTTVTNLYGVRVGPYAGSTGAITNGYGVFIDSSIDSYGGTVKAIKSNSVSDSEFAGLIKVPTEPYTYDDWSANESVPTKEDVAGAITGPAQSGKVHPLDVPDGVTVLTIRQITTSTTHLLYTVPVGHVLGLPATTFAGFANPTASAITNVRLTTSHGGNEFQTGGAVTLASKGVMFSGAGGQGGQYIPAGGTITVYGDAAGVAVFLEGLLIDMSKFPDMSLVQVNPTTTRTVFYTTPAGKRAIFVTGGNNPFLASGGATNAGASAANYQLAASAASVTVNTHVRPVSEAYDPLLHDTRTGQSISAVASPAVIFAGTGSLPPEHEISVTSSSSGTDQVMTALVILVDA